MIYKVSYVVMGSEHPGAIMNQVDKPKVGDHVDIGHHSFEVVEVQEMMAPRNDFQFMHATVREVALSQPDEEMESEV
jgi:hypothetical protein